MRMQAETKVVIALLRAAIGEQTFHMEEQDVSWETVEKILKAHRIVNMAYRGYLRLENKDWVPEWLAEKMKSEFAHATVREAHQHFALEEIRREFETNEVDFIPLKGSILKYMYPLPQMRIMGDLDILYRREQDEAVQSCLSKLGYTRSVAGELEDVYGRRPFLVVEMHKMLLSEPKAQKLYFDKIWDRVKPADGTQHEYEMTLEDYYLYLLAHMAKHFFNCGTGLRSLADFHVFHQKKGKELNAETVGDRLKKLKLDRFEAFLFEMDACVFEGQDNEDGAFQLAFDYVMESGIYGTRKHYHANAISSGKGADRFPLLGKIQYVLRTVFPDRMSMERLYPWLRGRRYLLVPAWICRMFQKMLFQRERAAQRLSCVQVDDRELYRMQQIQKRAGL